MCTFRSTLTGELLRNHWLRLYGELWRGDERQVKTLTVPAVDALFHVVHSVQLQSWYDSPAGKQRYSAPKCFFCDKHDEYNQLITVCSFGHLVVYQCVKFCEPAHYLIAPEEHREQIAIPDVRLLEKLSATAQLSVFANLRGSGASYPAHLHFQSLDVEFPATRSERSRVVYAHNGVKLEILDYPVLLLRFAADSDNGWELAAKLMCRIASPFNPLWWRGSIYIIPRTKSVPFNTAGNKFAAAEVFGRIYCRNRHFYDALDSETVLGALLDVCIPTGSPLARRFMQELECLIAKVSHEIQNPQRG